MRDTTMDRRVVQSVLRETEESGRRLDVEGAKIEAQPRSRAVGGSRSSGGGREEEGREEW
jgi:hypothetical protein